MADWVIYDVKAAAATLPPSLSAAYSVWLTDTERADRLELIAAGVVADFRKAVAAEADAIGKLDAASVPLSCLRHVSAVTWYMLANEMGAGAESFRPAWLDSEIYLRRLYQELEAGGQATGTPRYARGSASSGASNSAAPGRLLYGTGEDGGINYDPPVPG